MTTDPADDDFDVKAIADALTANLAGGLPRPEDQRPKLDITNEAESLDEIPVAMAKERGPDLYIRANAVSWIRIDDTEDLPKIHALTPDNLRAHIAENFHTYRMIAVGRGEDAKWVPQRVVPARVTCATLLGRKEWDLPVLRGVVTSPVLRPDRRLLQTAGYDEETGLYLAPRLPIQRIPDVPTREDIDEARSLILDQLLVDFPFVADSDRAQYVALLFAQIIRRMVPRGLTPLGMITASAPGSGKSYLSSILDYLYGLSSLTWSETEAELRKAITTHLISSGSPVILFDNVPNGFTVSSATLSKLLTDVHWDDRLLGTNDSASIPNDRLWIMTGNGLQTGKDMPRRTLWVRLDPNCPNPDQRTGFRLGDLAVWMRTGNNAARIMHALLTLATGWATAGAPRRDVAWGNYTPWASATAGLLDWIGIPGFLADRNETAAQDTDRELWEPLFTAWFEAYGDAPKPLANVLTTSAIAQHVRRTPKGDLPSAQQFGMQLRRIDGRFVGEYKVTSKMDDHTKVKLWTVRRYEGGNG